MTLAAWLIALAAAVAGPAGAQAVVNPDVDGATTPPAPASQPLTASQPQTALQPLTASQPQTASQPLIFLDGHAGVAGWGDDEEDSTEPVYDLLGRARQGPAYVMPDAANAFGTAPGSYAEDPRGAAFQEPQPRSDFVLAFTPNSGEAPAGARAISLLSSSFEYQVLVNATPVALLPLGPDPTSPIDPDDVPTYAGEWRGEVSPFAGELVTLQLVDGLAYDAAPPLGIAGVPLVPLAKASMMTLAALGVLALVLAVRHVGLPDLLGRGAPRL